MTLAESLVDHACRAGLVQTPADLDLVERLAAEVVARREAYLDGLLERKAASVAICRAADWRHIAGELAYIERAREHRARLYDPAPRTGDYLGRRTA